MRCLFRKDWRLALLGPVLGLMHSHCALQIDDPVANLNEKIAQPIPLTDSLLRGEWVGDSTYTLRDTRAYSFTSSELRLSLYRDSRYRAVDKSSLVFGGVTTGNLTRRGDSLFFVDGSSGKVSIWIGKLSFKGNYLNLYQPEKLRHSFYHRIPFVDTLSPQTFLEKGFFMRTARRDSQDAFTFEPLTHAFDYLTFASGKWRRESWRQGLVLADSGAYRVNQDTLHLLKDADTADPEIFTQDFLHADTLRLWPLGEKGYADGYHQFARRDSLPRWHRDLRPFMGYWRGDSARDDSGFFRMGFERFHDLEILPDGQVKSLTQNARLPAFQAWKLDTGRMIFTGAQNTSFPLFPSQPGHAQDTLILLDMARDPGLKRLVFYGTRRDGKAFVQNPLARFPHLDHAWMRFTQGGMAGEGSTGGGSAGDSLAYLSAAAWASVSQGPERVEFGIFRTDTLWLSFTLPREASASSDERDFAFSMHGRTERLGRFQCASRPDLALTLRRRNAAGDRQTSGTVQGLCRIETSEKTVADTVLSLEGEYLITRTLTGSLRSPLWTR